MRLSIFAVAVVLTASPAASEIRLEGTILEEAELDRALISKPGWLRGLHFAGREMPEKDRPKLRTVLPADWSGETICARVTSIGGDYSAMIEFEVPADMKANEKADLGFAATSDIARRITPENSGVSIEKGRCLGDSVGEDDRAFIANFWNEEDQPIINESGQAQLVLNMNISRADELQPEAKWAGGPITPECTKLTDPQALAYNYRCTMGVPAYALTGSEVSPLTFSYTRIYRGRPSDRRKAIIFIGAGQ